VDAHGDRTALSTSSGDFTYTELLQAAAAVAPAVPQSGGNVAIMAGRSFEYAAATAGVWMAGGTCVPMCESHPPPELEYVLGNAECTAVLCEARFAEMMRPIAEKIGLPFHEMAPFDAATTPALAAAAMASGAASLAPDVTKETPAIMIYTSGTTGPPKGVVLTHGNTTIKHRHHTVMRTPISTMR
jgi:malonyl-CoA/methylmalonyl-CoA synthetase